VADPRELWIAGRGRRSVEDARRKAAANTPEVMMSQTPEWYQNRENLSRAKDVLGNIPAVTTDPNESRNMYQMLMHQMKGGDRGARLIDTSGLPPGARRYGRTLFTDPAKSQGIMGDFGSLLSGKNKAAVRAKEYNPFPKAGFGTDWHKDQFGTFDPGGLFEGILKLATPLKYFKGKERIPLERDPRFTPVHGSADWESSIFDLTGDYDVDTGYGWEDEGLSGYGTDPSYNEPITITDLMPDEVEDITETITEDDGEEFVLKKAEFSQGNLGTEGKYDYSPNLDLNIRDIQDYELKKKATDAAIQFNNVWLQGEDGEYYGQLEDLYQEYLDAVEAGAQ